MTLLAELDALQAEVDAPKHLEAETGRSGFHLAALTSQWAVRDRWSRRPDHNPRPFVGPANREEASPRTTAAGCAAVEYAHPSDSV